MRKLRVNASVTAALWLQLVASVGALLLLMACGSYGLDLPLSSDADATGAVGGACFPNGTCNAGLECVAERCQSVDAAVGELGGPCTQGGLCVGALECRDGLCRESGVGAPTSESSSSPTTGTTPSGPPSSGSPSGPATGNTPSGPPSSISTEAGTGVSADPPAGFIRIEPASFTMGSPEGELERIDIREAQESVTLTRAFFLQSTPVTQGPYTALMGTNPSGFDECGPDCPVESLNWFEAVAYANALSESEGLAACYDESGEVVGGARVYDCEGYRLPTEAEWEYAARAGTTTATYNGELPGADCEASMPVLDEIAWYDCNSDTGAGGTTHPVGQKEANAWGLYDMLGNVWEWTDTRYQDAISGGVDPEGPSTGSTRVLRGGSWINVASGARAARRYGNDPEGRSYSRGFRLARSAP